MRDNMAPLMAPEDQLCLLLARGRIPPEVQKQVLELLASPLCWPLLLERAYRYDIVPLLYRNLQTLGFHGVPEPTRLELANFFKVNAIRNELFIKELARILRLLGDAGVPVAPLKSVVLAESLYEDPALRVCADIDVLVPAKNIAEAFHFVLSIGYTSHVTQPSLLDLLVRYGKDCELIREDHLCTYPLELHCGLVWGGSLERNVLEEVWADAERKTFFGIPAFALSPDWEFLYLAVHAARHGWFSLKWFVDLDRLCSRKTMNWGAVARKAQALGWEDAVRYSLSVCARLFDTPINPALGPITLPGLSRVPNRSDIQVANELLFSFRLLRTPVQKLRFLTIRLLVPTSADCKFLPLPPLLFPLYYLLRPLRITCKAIWWFVQAAGKRILGHR